MDHHKLDNLYLMRLFTLIVRLGSFAAAARQLQITAGKVSKDIHFLEQRLQTRLLHRTTRSLMLTDDGELYFQQAERILELNEQLLDSLRQRRHELAGELRITAPELWGELVLTPVLLGFKAKHPQVSIVAEFSNRPVDLLQDGFHIAFRSTRLSSEPYIARELGQDESVLCAAPAYLASRLAPAQPGDLLQHELVTLAQGNSRNELWCFEHSSGQQQLEVRGSLVFNNKKAIHAAVCHGFGVARLPKYLAEPSLKQGKLQTVLPEYRLKSATFYALYTQRRRESALIRAFIDAVEQALSLQALV
ncbi:LysR family transcriptional regulator [Shewanella algae]|uniref:LysR family transcriptional regulator n=2 Tax=Shewanella algae TaxID=38313 RepID=UPI001181FA6C|nr:LysR family transcriptional regulator [Shewanella algae]MBO2663976.1 LysR family transcriptional regulator [Shewanella algae]MCL1055050.1 LysR family transcriptional regulator [Shewanella algae]TVO84125.1 transcriptional regulator [Shewanella algae]TXS87758.1 transcriptional regulator [Shewanella algae]